VGIALVIDPTLQQSVFDWLDHVVIGQNFCPFARGVRQRERIELVVSPSADVSEALQGLSNAANSLRDRHVDDTLLYLLPEGFDDFDEFLDFLSLAEALFADLGHEGFLQIASFHPEYCFADVDKNHVGNWTNRSPVPILHVLNEESVEVQIQRYPDVDNIPARNIDKLESMDATEIEQLKRICRRG